MKSKKMFCDACGQETTMAHISDMTSFFPQTRLKFASRNSIFDRYVRWFCGGCRSEYCCDTHYALHSFLDKKAPKK